MQVVVTGGWGTAGRYVVEELLRGPHEVTVVSRRPQGAIPGVRWVEGDVLRLGDLLRAFQGADAVVHLAAALPNRGLAPEEVFQVNAVGAFHVHEAAYRLGIPKVVSCSSTAVLGWDWGPRDVRPAYLPFDEDHPLWPQDPYGLSKQVLEAVAQAYHRKGRMDTPVLRPPLIVTPERLDELRRTGGLTPNGFYHYAYIDARDLARAFRLAVERAGLGHAVLFVAADDSSVAEPLSLLLPRMLPGVEEMARRIPGFQSAIATDRAKRVLGWSPRYSWRPQAA